MNRCALDVEQTVLTGDTHTSGASSGGPQPAKLRLAQLLPNVARWQ